MRKQNLTHAITISIILIATAACNKFYDIIYLPKGGDIKGLCAISKFKFAVRDNGGKYFTDVATVKYNVQGNPVNITQSYTSEDGGYTNWDFRYDKKNRLSDAIGYFGNGDAYIWHRYVYDSKDRIIIDTAYNGGGVHTGASPTSDPDNIYFFWIDKNIYDSKGRVVKVNRNLVNDNINEVYTYTYNSQDNLQKITNESSGDVTTYSSFDNKLNYLLTNNVWKFLTKDYSINNHAQATSYNSIGLPTMFTAGASLIIDDGLAGYRNDIIYIEYQCK